MQLTDEQVLEALEENGHREVAQALADKLEGREQPEQSTDMNSRIRAATGRQEAR
jgi:hypothetical protein